jgi:hypothetical protein
MGHHREHAATEGDPELEESDDAGEGEAEEFELNLRPGDRFYVYRPPWRRPKTLLLVVLGTVLFFVPLAIDGLWWLTLAASIAVIGALAIVGAPAHRPQAALAALFVALLAFVGLEAYNDVAFGTLSLRGAPPLIFACGSEYTHSSGTPVLLATTVALHRVGITPSGMELLGNKRCGGAHSVWAFVAVGTGRVLPYLADHYTGQPVPYWR